MLNYRNSLWFLLNQTYWNYILSFIKRRAFTPNEILLCNFLLTDFFYDILKYSLILLPHCIMKYANFKYFHNIIIVLRRPTRIRLNQLKANLKSVILFVKGKTISMLRLVIIMWGGERSIGHWPWVCFHARNDIPRFTSGVWSWVHEFLFTGLGGLCSTLSQRLLQKDTPCNMQTVIAAGNWNGYSNTWWWARC